MGGVVSQSPGMLQSRLDDAQSIDFVKPDLSLALLDSPLQGTDCYQVSSRPYWARVVIEYLLQR